MSTRTWRKGPPPHVGWWNASRVRNERTWRWWNGRVWSLDAYAISRVEYATTQARRMAFDQIEIKWTNYWPENARVPRVDPNEVKS